MIAHCPEHGAYDSGDTTALLPCPRCHPCPVTQSPAHAEQMACAWQRTADERDAARAALRGLLGVIDRAGSPILHRQTCPAYRCEGPCRCGADAAVRAARAAVPEQGGTE